MGALGIAHIVQKSVHSRLQLLDNPKTIGEHIKRNRVVLCLTQKDIAKIIGVSEDCITYWENGRSKPQKRYYYKIIELLGYDPFPNSS